MLSRKTKNKEEFKNMETINDVWDIINFTNELIILAVNSWVSDIHIEPLKDFISIRFREDWDFVYVLKISHDEYAKFLSRIKIMSNLRIDEKHKPQDWKIGFKIEKTWEMIDLRISILPIIDWEKIVMRILRQDPSILNIDKLEFLPLNLSKIKNALKSQYWLILVTWPTGSGKSTTLFSILNYFNPLDYNISTLEDPVEYNIPYINQTQIRPDIWFDFASWLRSLVRQDPNIIMVWEIRDKETAMLAIEAALTWHLVLSTIHTNSASATIQRLMNMWIEPFLIASALKLVISQRLIKKICQSCKQKYKIKEVALENKIDWYLKSMNISEKAIDLDFYNPVWCDKCNNSWCLWRIWVHEVLVMQEELDSLILNKSSVNEIEDKAEKLWMITIMQDWILKAATGKTTIEEVLKLI